MSNEDLPISLQGMVFIHRDPQTDKPIQQITIPAVMFWAFYRTVKAVGFETALLVALLGLTSSKPQGDVLTKLEVDTLTQALLALDDAGINQWRNKEDGALELTYTLLREGSINREQAADFATDILGTPVGTEAWRKRLDKWANETGRTRVDLPRGRPPKRKPEKTSKNS